jgi:hypothetical protein
MAATVAAGLVVRFAHLGLPTFVVKYGGSTMWALMIYWIVSTLLPLWPIVAVALLGGAVATAVEFLKLCHWPALDAFRLTLPGHRINRPLLFGVGHCGILGRHLSCSSRGLSSSPTPVQCDG